MNPAMPRSESALSDPVHSSSAVPARRAQLRIVIADDHPVVREGLKKLLANESDLTVVGEARDGDEAFRAAVQLSPDLIILDLIMPGVNGIEAARQIKRSRPQVKIIGLSVSEDTESVSRLIGCGVEGFVVKRAAGDELVTAIRTVQGGGIHVDPRMNPAQLQTGPGNGQNARIELSPREESILRLLARGYTNKEIAALLDLSIKTIETYKVRAMEKTGLRSRVEIVSHGAQRGWLASEHPPVSG